MDSTRIMKEKEIQNNNNQVLQKNSSLYGFMSDNREICLKNFLLDLLKGERNSIQNKELTVTKALDESKNKLDFDYGKFIKFTEIEKNKQKLMEQKLVDYVTKNRSLQDKKKKLVQENKQIMDELDRTVKIILNFKGNAVFVNSVIGDPKNKLFKDDINILDSKNFDYSESQGKEKDLEKVTEALIEEFSYVEKEQKDEVPEVLKDYTRMSACFVELEENILKLMDSKQNIEKEIDKMTLEHRYELNELKEREEQVKKEKERLLVEKDKDEKVIKDLKKHTEGEGPNQDIVKMIKDLYATTMFDEDFGGFTEKNQKKIKSKNVGELIKELMESLRVIIYILILVEN
jgi:hypothetical protein